MSVWTLRRMTTKTDLPSTAHRIPDTHRDAPGNQMREQAVLALSMHDCNEVAAEVCGSPVDPACSCRRSIAHTIARTHHDAGGWCKDWLAVRDVILLEPPVPMVALA